MTEISDRYRRLAGRFAEMIGKVGVDQWAASTPCVEWTTRDLVAHVIEAHGIFLGFVGQALGDTPDPAREPAAAFAAARAQVQAALDDPAVAQAEYQGFTGTSTFEAGVNQFLCFDLVIHGWDLARATGQDETIDPEDVTRVREQALAMGDAMRSPRAFGPELEPPAGAGAQSRLLAFLGRQP